MIWKRSPGIGGVDQGIIGPGGLLIVEGMRRRKRKGLIWIDFVEKRREVGEMVAL